MCNFIKKYGNGKAIRRLYDQINMLNSGEKHLVFDNGDIITFNYSQPSGLPDEIYNKYGDYGVRKVIHKYTHDEIRIGELSEKQKKYI